MGTRITYLVKAYHPDPKYSFFGPIQATQDSQGAWSAWNPDLGCGKDRDTAEEALRLLVRDHALVMLSAEIEKVEHW